MNEWIQAILNVFTNPTFYKSTLTQSTPLILAAMGGVFSETTGVTNIALEGIMLMGAFGGVMGSYFTGNPWYGLALGTFFGLAMAALHAWASIKYGADQIISGTALILLAQGITGFALVELFGQPGSTDLVRSIPLVDLGSFKDVPFFGPIFGNLSPFVYMAFASVIFGWILIYKTKLGLRMRSVGNNPEAADTLGINVYNVRYFGVIMSGLFAALGGAYLSIGELGQFTTNMTNGRGFIALAAMIIGNWNPVGAMSASLLFGAATAFNNQLQSQSILNLSTNTQYIFGMIPYIITLIVVAGFIGKSRAPSADGIPYIKE
ncbi:ABC transporter permease [Athalassotoga saccharophila]|uniref:ABC transporter permease n=1 Tax=Athalassotoga saccharophila TaxID=1441386 RepID=UPI00137A547D|nr:ABC transporter permease [Athalassotoga saccharophila]BBJ27340.1 ABC transporter, permease protein 2 [Athalassotoga saccharophila]